ncbi:transposase [Tsuneonella mangrovi]|uniref:transposase n=1 Tax=Tsuneonella mangrovi TaxID=1982042 RepID=UPI000BA24187|nr:transposase [Tsuneonella mangrovi]
MPRVIAIADETECSLEECRDAIAAEGFDPSDRDSVDGTARWLKRLANNRTFLGDILAAELAQAAASDSDNGGYGPQAIMLSPARGGFFLRANIWPSEDEHIMQASGAQAFAYGLPHDHNFDFLTVGYFGPGYASDYYEFDYERIAGFPGEDAGLRFVERATLSPGKIMHYRAHRDVHAQFPPSSLSISLNVMATCPVQPWFDQYAFDTAAGTVARVLTSGANETFMRIAVGLGSEAARDLAADFAVCHPSDRMRLACIEAQASVMSSREEQDRLWRRAEAAGSRMVAVEAKLRRSALESIPASG